MMLGFLAGIVVGAGAVLLWAFHLGRLPKPQQRENAGIHCATLGDASIETTNAYLLKQILSEVDKHSLYEIKPRIQ
jgi:hypothetical protein